MLAKAYDPISGAFAAAQSNTHTRAYSFGDRLGTSGEPVRPIVLFSFPVGPDFRQYEVSGGKSSGVLSSAMCWWNLKDLRRLEGSLTLYICSVKTSDSLLYERHNFFSS